MTGDRAVSRRAQATYVPDLAAQLIDTIAGLVAGQVTEARIDASIARLDRLTTPPTFGGT